LAEIDRMLPLCDTVLVACALVPETKGLIDARRLALMKPGTLLINVARAAIVDEDALYMALKDGHLGGAAIDVWWQCPTAAEPERRPSRRPFHELSNVLMTPHSSSSSEATADRRWSAVAGNLDRFARGKPERRVSDLIEGYEGSADLKTIRASSQASRHFGGTIIQLRSRRRRLCLVVPTSRLLVWRQHLPGKHGINDEEETPCNGVLASLYGPAGWLQSWSCCPAASPKRRNSKGHGS
jgi:hypothetical protein